MNFPLTSHVDDSIIKHMLKEAAKDTHKKRPRGPKPVRVEASYLLDAAIRVFARDGVDGATIRAIAREARCDPSLLYYHFENKEAIFIAILDRKYGQMMPDLEGVAAACAGQQSSDGPPLKNARGRTPLQEALWQIPRVYYKHLKDDAGFRAMMRGKVQARQGFSEREFMKYLFRMVQPICTLFDGGVKSGELRKDIDPSITAFFLLRACIDMVDIFPVFSANFMSMPPEDTRLLVERQWFELFWAGIANISYTTENK